jgi:hypothetical protein
LRLSGANAALSVFASSRALRIEFAGKASAQEYLTVRTGVTGECASRPSFLLSFIPSKKSGTAHKNKILEIIRGDPR